MLSYLVYFGFSGIAWPLWMAGVVLLAWQVAGRRVALFALAALGFIVLTGMWERAMVSLYLCAAAAILSFALGAALGVWAAVSNTVSAVLRPIADTFQTIPQFVFLIPALVGTTGLGQQIFLALSSADTGLGLVAGLSMALLAMVADRILQALAADQQRYSA